uniref:ATP synthase complex subunit 8 n=1 Tax=Thesaurus albertalleni TaxID=2529511 RepID=A0A7G7MUB2_9CUCU|nr:ATP synthase F0 subunit 8 [Thesaurus albertalleni]QNG56421.1 ATP synthase F0 subunit 8 [Thesaurus albertalleni]
MPQMAPLSWLTLFFFFLSIFILYNIMNYFSFTYPIKTSKMSKLTIKTNWKW